jgi:hypothetical protein
MWCVLLACAPCSPERGQQSVRDVSDRALQRWPGYLLNRRLQPWQLRAVEFNRGRVHNGGIARSCTNHLNLRGALGRIKSHPR